MSSAARATLVCFFAAVALAIAMVVGTTRLVVAGGGFLSATALLLSLALAAVGAGAWGSAAELTTRTNPRRRALLLTLALVLAAGYLLRAGSSVPESGVSGSGALGAMLLLAAPGYAAGALFVALAERERALVPAALFGAASGVLITAGLLIPLLQPWAAVLIAGALAGFAIPLAPPPRNTTESEAAMHDRVIIVTGVGDRGQAGYAIAQRLRAAGARLVVTGRGDGVIEMARELGAEDVVVAVPADLSSDEGSAAVVAAAQSRFARIDGLVNVAGGLSVIASIETTTPEQWAGEMQRNAETAFRMSRAALAALRASRGAIVNFASPAAFHAPASLGAYSAAKAAVVALTRSLAVEERDRGVRVNAIAPGLLDTAQNRESGGDDARFVSREEVADVVLFLLSPASAGITGETISVLGKTIA